MAGISQELERALTELSPDFRLCPRCRCCNEEWEECYECGGEGWRELYDLDPLWYDEDEMERCDICNGKGGWWRCGGNCDENGKHEPKEAQR